MKRKYIGLIVFTIIISCLFIGNISAYSCIYEGGDLDPNGLGDIQNSDGEESIELEVNTKDNSIEVIPSSGLNRNKLTDDGEATLPIFDEFLDDNFKKDDYIKQTKNRCPSQINVMIVHVPSFGDDGWYTAVLLNDDMIYSSSKLKTGIDMAEKYDNDDFKDYDFCIDEKGRYDCFYNNNDNIASWKLNESKSDKPAIDLSLSCTVYKKYFGKDYSKLKYITEDNKKYIELDNSKNKEIDRVTDKSQYGNYGLYYLYSYYNENCKKNNKNSKCKEVMTSFNSNETMLSNFCKNIINKRDYGSACMQECLDLNATLYKLTREDKSGACHLSDQIIAFIYNILKWVKYIAPVLVIILGILDFVKALAAQDDDAMKKAQGKFVKRMIAAVLLFLLPLIIDYVLSVFHLVNDSCNINKIF